MTKQEIFNKVWLGLASQGFHKSSPEKDKIGACYYRYNGLKCAAGWIIPDEEYHTDMDDIDNGDTGVYSIDWFKDKFNEEELTFIAMLQSDHDCSKSPADMKKSLQMTAENFKLEMPKLSGPTQ